MPTSTIVGHTNDGYIVGFDLVYADARGSSTADGIDGVDNIDNMYVGQQFNSGYYWVYRTFLKFDTSVLAPIVLDAVPSRVYLTLTALTDGSTTDFDVQIEELNWSAYDPILDSGAAFDLVRDGSSVAVWRNTSGISVNTQYNSPDLTLSYINRTGYTYYALRSSRDAGSNAPSGLEYLILAAAEHATSAYRPTLVVEYGVHDQKHYRWRNDDGSESSATGIVAENTTITTRAKITATRLRIQTDVTAGDPPSEALTLQYRKVGEAPWRDISL